MILYLLPHAGQVDLGWYYEPVWHNLDLKVPDPRFWAFLADFRGWFQALLDIVEKWFKQKKNRRKKLARGLGDEPDLAQAEMQNFCDKPQFRAKVERPYRYELILYDESKIMLTKLFQNLNSYPHSRSTFARNWGFSQKFCISVWVNPGSSVNPN